MKMTVLKEARKKNLIYSFKRYRELDIITGYSVNMFQRKEESMLAREERKKHLNANAITSL